MTTVVGVDVGGTKTHACVADDSGRVLGFATGPGGNWEGVGLDGLSATLKGVIAESIDHAGIAIDGVDAAAYAMAGIDWVDDVRHVTPALDSVGITGPRVVVNDAFAALRAGSPRGVGVASVAGTGGVTVGRDSAGRTFRTLGQGVGEAGGAGQVVEEAIRAVARGWYGQIEVTDLTHRLVEAYEARDVEDLLAGFFRRHVPLVAEHAPLIFDCARAGDPIAQHVITTVGAAHGMDVVGVASRLKLAADVDVVRAGSVHLDGEPTFENAFCDVVMASYPAAQITTLHVPPVTGAVLLALEAAGCDVESVWSELGRDVSAMREVVGTGV